MVSSHTAHRWVKHLNHTIKSSVFGLLLIINVKQKEIKSSSCTLPRYFEINSAQWCRGHSAVAEANSTRRAFMLCTYICLHLSRDNEVGVQQSANVAGANACAGVAAVKIPGSLNEMSTTMQLNALNNAPQFPVQSPKCLLIITSFWSPRCTLKPSFLFHTKAHFHSPLCAAGPACGWWWPAGCRWRSRSGRWGWGPWIFSSWTSRAASALALRRVR